MAWEKGKSEGRASNSPLQKKRDFFLLTLGIIRKNMTWMDSGKGVARWRYRCLCMLLYTLVWSWGGLASAADGEILKMSPGLKLNSLAAHPDAELIELSDGKRVRLGDLRRVEQAARKLRNATSGTPPAGLQFKPGAGGTRVEDAAGLAAALKRPDSDTIILPSGRRVTAGQLRFVQPRVEMRLGRPLEALAKRPPLDGQALKVDDKTDWSAILKKPDQTVLESPSGKRITVGELKRAIVDGKLPLKRPSANLQ